MNTKSLLQKCNRQEKRASRSPPLGTPVRAKRVGQGLEAVAPPVGESVREGVARLWTTEAVTVINTAAFVEAH